MIQKFKMPTDLSDLPQPTVEALDGNFDAVEAHINTVVHSELEGLHKLVAELTARVSALDIPVT